jgi:SAM-dependent methyltransferase/catechol 2,3-dioxygenase-like lactoylglutathione lyase family enzyme
MRIAPILNVSDMRAATAFYSMLGFATDFTYAAGPDGPAYASVSLAGHQLHLSTFAGDGVRGTAVYFYVDDVDVVFRGLLDAGLKTPGKPESPVEDGPVDQSWGMREFYVRDPDGNTLRCGSPIPALTGDRADTRRLYTDLAWLWPMWGSAEEYAHYCRHVTGLIEQHARRPARTLLNIGCGGGKNVSNLKQTFRVTGVDLSPAMLAQASELNPECTFVQGDMRTIRLGMTFDAVLMDDAVSYMTCVADLAAAVRTAAVHLEPGGVMVATPDATTETFRQNRTIATPGTHAGTGDGPDVVFVENVYDPDPGDEQYETTVVYLIREHGRLRTETDHWTMGLFSLETWRQVLRDAGFEVHEGRYDAGEDEYTVFACVKR